MQISNQGKWRHLVGKFGTNAVSAAWWSKLEPIECWIILSTEFACFVTGEINQVIEAIPGSVVPLAMFLRIYIICISFKYAFSDLLQLGSKFGHQVTSLPKFEGCPPGWVTCIATLPWITLLTLSVSIKLVSLSARVTSVKFQHGLGVCFRDQTHRSDQETWVR